MSFTTTVRFISISGTQTYHVFNRGGMLVGITCSSADYVALGLTNAIVPTSGTAGDIWMYSMTSPAFSTGEPVNNDCLMFTSVNALSGSAMIVRPPIPSGWRKNWVGLPEDIYNPVRANAITLRTDVAVPPNAVG